MKTIIGAALLFLLANFADYELQAYQHGWVGLLDLTYRAAPWGMFDFIPHDAWHLAQWTRNLCMITPPMLVVMWYSHTFPKTKPGTPYFWQSRSTVIMYKYRHLFVFLAAIGLYVATRGVGFSLMYRLWN